VRDAANPELYTPSPAP